MTILEYNGYQFNQYSNISINAQMQDDDSGRTTLYHRHHVRVETTIYAEGNDQPGQAGQHFRRIRDRLTKKGQGLVIHHEGFEANGFEVNTRTNAGPRDVTFGPHPKVVTWDPVGHENAVEVVWECEFCLSTCNRWTGIMALNYGISTRIDSAGYTTRTVSGYLEIAMTRVGRQIPDTADAYREAVIIDRLPNFQREHTWNLSLDKRRADFTIVDTEIRSPNAFPYGVINIQGSHNVNWARRQPSTLPQTIQVMIELASDQPRSRAWEIFKAIVEARLIFVQSETIMLDNLNVEESLFSNSFAFSINYRFLTEPIKPLLTAFAGLFSATGIGSPVRVGNWNSWGASVGNLQSHRGRASLRHLAANDQIIDLCSSSFLNGITGTPSLPTYTPPSRNNPLSNVKPKSPRKSYIRFESWVETVEETPTVCQVAVGEDDLSRKDFSPDSARLEFGTAQSQESVTRFIETQAGRIEIIWSGYAERMGYPIPRPDRLVLYGENGEKYVLTRVGRAKFKTECKPDVLGQPVYYAAWKQRYVLNRRLSTLKGVNGWDPDKN